MSMILTQKPNGHAVAAALVSLVPNAARPVGSGVSSCAPVRYERGAIAGGNAAGAAAAEGAARPAVAPVAVKNRVEAVAFDRTRTVGSAPQLFGHDKTQLLTMWALRGLDPWSQPT